MSPKTYNKLTIYYCHHPFKPIYLYSIPKKQAADVLTCTSSRDARTNRHAFVNNISRVNHISVVLSVQISEDVFRSNLIG